MKYDAHNNVVLTKVTLRSSSLYGLSGLFLYFCSKQSSCHHCKLLPGTNHPNVSRALIAVVISRDCCPRSFPWLLMPCQCSPAGWFTTTKSPWTRPVWLSRDWLTVTSTTPRNSLKSPGTISSPTSSNYWVGQGT